MPAASLYIVATPLGNLEDITLRALRILSQADVVAAEDTRHSRGLLAHHGIERRLVALHEHNEEKQAARLVERLLAGESVALISDAGTPLLSDPGYRLISLAIDNGVPVVPVPGASAVTAALSVAGLPTDRFVFEGFLPPKQGARLRRLQALAAEQRSLVFFESSHRIAAFLADLEAAFGGERRVAVCRELTKQFETVLRGSVEAVRQTVESDGNQRKGEFVVVVHGRPEEAGSGLDAALLLARELKESVGASQAARIAGRIHGVPRRDLYRLL
jgi:16S rRNA (cytidine1402-2'-O)-methyltransferase